MLTLCVIGSYATGGGILMLNDDYLWRIGYFSKRDYGVAPVVLRPNSWGYGKRPNLEEVCYV